MRALWLSLFCTILVVGSWGQSSPWISLLHAKGEQTESERLAAFIDAHWHYQMTEFPDWATWVGYPGQDDRWTDYSLEAIHARHRVDAEMLDVIRSFDRDALTPEEQLNLDLLNHHLSIANEQNRFPMHLLAINQMGGVHQSAPMVLNMMPTQTRAQYDNLLARLEALPVWVGQVFALLQEGLEQGITTPRITLRDVPDQILNLVPEAAAESPLMQAFSRIPERLDNRDAIRAQATTLYDDSVRPAFLALHAFLVNEYIPNARQSIACREHPNGQAWYETQVDYYTTTDLTAQEIHDIGHAEVKRIRAEMDAVIESTGFEGTFEAFLEFLRTDEQFYFENGRELIREYRDISKRADAEMPRLFGRLPRLSYGVRPIPSFSAPSQTTAYYQPGSPAAGRPGYFYANTYNLSARPRYEMEALTLHEAVPGHHHQIALSQELEGLPEFRKHMDFTVYVEGWGLYSESLGEEMGFYTDPYSKFGQLTYEIWRAIRLVVDTGMHSLGWTRDEAIAFFKANSGKTEHDITVEIDRYIVWPGQALAYKIGELKIRELRADAEEKLGDAFDIRAFHDELLGQGAMPIRMLEERMRTWMDAQK